MFDQIKFACDAETPAQHLEIINTNSNLSLFTNPVNSSIVSMLTNLPTNKVKECRNGSCHNLSSS